MQKRIIFSIILSILTILISLGIISYFSVKDSIDRSLQSRLALANIMGKYIDDILESNLTRLYDISISGRIDFDDNNWGPEKKALKTAYDYSIFTDRIFLLDLYGNIVLTYPHQEGGRVNLLSIPYISKTLSERKPVISDIYSLDSIQKKLIFALVPLKNKNGEVIGVAGGEMNPTNYLFVKILKTIPEGSDTFIELVDSHGTIIASNDPKYILTSSDHNKYLARLIAKKKNSVGTCHRCHSDGYNRINRSKDMIAFSPLSVAPWGISVREPQEIVFAPAIMLKRGFTILGLVAIVTALILAIGISRSIVRPVQELITATRKIGKGNLSEPVKLMTRDEIGTLAESFESMRVKLAESLQNIREQNIELENRVFERTKQIRDSQRKIRNLLKQVISSVEDERKRIARELHDETLQDISAFLMNIDMCRLYPEKITVEKIEEMRKLVLKTRRGVHNITQNLRPSALDDLGLESALQWLLDSHLVGGEVQYFLTIDGTINEGFNPQFEITLFRIIQEAITNIARHSNAENIFIVLKTKDSFVQLYIEDDGDGFDVYSFLSHTFEDGRGLGLIGMKERAALLNGNLKICSSPGRGTAISFSCGV